MSREPGLRLSYNAIQIFFVCKDSLVSFPYIPFLKITKVYDVLLITIDLFTWRHVLFIRPCWRNRWKASVALYKVLFCTCRSACTWFITSELVPPLYDFDRLYTWSARITIPFAWFQPSSSRTSTYFFPHLRLFHTSKTLADIQRKAVWGWLCSYKR